MLQPYTYNTITDRLILIGGPEMGFILYFFLIGGAGFGLPL